MPNPSWDDTKPTDGADQTADSGAAPTWDSTKSFEEEYGGLSGAAKALALSAADTATLGVSTYGLTKTGAITPERAKGYLEQNPISTMAGIPVGIVGMLALGPESAAAKAAAEAAELAGGTSKAIQAAKAAANTSLKGFEAADLLNPVKTISRLGGTVAEAVAPSKAGGVLAQAGAHALGSAAEAQFYTLGNAVSESALGDPDAFGEKLVSNMGTNALFGGALGAVFGGLKGRSMGKGLQGSGESLPAALSREGSPLLSNAEISGTVADAPRTGVQPSSFQELENKVAAAKANGTSVELPQKSILESSTNRIEMENPVHPLQSNSLQDQGTRNKYLTIRDSDSREGDALRNYEALQKNELVNKTDQTIKDISPGIEPTSDAAEGGNRAIKIFTDQYQKEASESGKLINELKSLKGEGFDHLSGMVQKWTDAIPELSKVFNVTEDGISVSPYKTTMGVTKQTYNAVREAVKSLKDNPQDFKDLFNIRKGLENGINLFTADRETGGQISRLKSSMMDYIQSLVDEKMPNVRESFKKYAINEQERLVIEKAFGASVGSPEFGAISKIKPENIGDRIFSNTASVDAAKRILGPKKFNEVLADWLSKAKKEATIDGNFSSKKFSRFLREKQDVLNAAFKDNPDILQRIGDLTTIMRILPDSAPINPSGTAKTLIGMLKNLPHNISWERAISYLPQKVLELISHQSEMSQLGDELAGKSAKVDGLGLIERTSAKVTRSINSEISNIFSGNPVKSSLIAISSKDRSDNHDKISKKLSEFTSNPEKLIDHLSENTEELSKIAPQTAQSVQSTITRGIQFLQEKLPGNNIPNKALSPKYKPSDTEISKWHKYFSAVEDPISLLHSVAMGTLVPEQIEAVSTVTPKLMNEMRTSVMDKMSKHMSQNKEIPYRTKLSLSLFMGEDLVNSLDPTNMIANQNMLATATQAKEQAESGLGKTSKGGLSKMKQSNRLLTPMQGSAQRQEA